MADYDGIIVGGGHNGLTCGAYLARSGMKVAVVERNRKIGGGCLTEEVTLPGFRHNLHSNFHVFTDGPVVSDLQLDRYGLEYVYPDIPNGMIFPDGTAFCIYRDLDRTVESIARISSVDAHRYRELYGEFGVRGRQIVISSMFSPPAARQGTIAELADSPGARIVGDGTKTPYEVVDEHFEDERIRCIFKSYAHTLFLRDTPGLGFYFLGILTSLPRFALPRGGSDALPMALGKVIEESGGSLMTDSHVAEVIVEGGRARGVRLASGERILSSGFVASAVDVNQTIGIAGESHFGEAISTRVQNLEPATHSLVTLHLALRNPPGYVADAFEPNINYAYNKWFGLTTGAELDAMFSEAIDQGKLPEQLHGNGSCNTLVDPSYAPKGMHTAFWWPYAPYALMGNPLNWDDPALRDEIANEMLTQWRAFAPNLDEDNVLGTHLFTPLDNERTNINMRKGSQQGIAYIPSQLDVNRPTPELSDYRTPVEGLYLCGFDSHPGGGVTSAPGYNCANTIAEDFGIERWWTPIAEVSWSE